VTTPKFAAQAIKKAAEMDWKPIHLLNNVSGSIGGVLKPAGLDNSKGLSDGAVFQGPDRPDLEE
jgi:branched-chain amino acid transport system substrate-binding protein